MFIRRHGHSLYNVKGTCQPGDLVVHARRMIAESAPSLNPYPTIYSSAESQSGSYSARSWHRPSILAPCHEKSHEKRLPNRHPGHQDADTTPPALKEVHALGKSPVIVNDGLLLSESGAIMSYLLEKYDTAGRFSPPRTALKA